MVSASQAMAADSNVEQEQKKRWQFYECSLLLNICFKWSNSGQASELKKAVIDNDYQQVTQALAGHGKHKLNKLLTFRSAGCTVHIPPLCVAIFHRNLDIIRCLLKHGADPNRLGQIRTQGQKGPAATLMSVNPLLLALEDHPDEELPFDPVVVSALLEAGADINTKAAGRVREEEEEGGSIDYDSGNTPLHNCTDLSCHSSQPVFHFLLDKGADMLIKNACGRTPLQSVLESLLDNPDQESQLSVFADELIRRGGFTHNPEELERSEFQLAMQFFRTALTLPLSASGAQERVHLLLDAGYECSKKDVAEFEKSGLERYDRCLSERVRGMYVEDLKHLCRLKIRRSVGHSCSPGKLSQLPLPTFMLQYINLL